MDRYIRNIYHIHSNIVLCSSFVWGMVIMSKEVKKPSKEDIEKYTKEEMIEYILSLQDLLEATIALLEGVVKCGKN